MSTPPAFEPPQVARPGPFWTVIETAMIVAFIAMLAVMFVQVASRYALGIGVPWTDETSRFLYITQIFLGVAVAQRHGAHIRITIVLDVLAPRVRRVIEALADLCIMLIVAALLVGAYRMTLRTSGVSASTLPVMMGWLYAVQGFGIFLYGLLAARDAVVKLRAAFGRAGAP